MNTLAKVNSSIRNESDFFRLTVLNGIAIFAVVYLSNVESIASENSLEVILANASLLVTNSTDDHYLDEKDMRLLRFIEANWPKKIPGKLNLEYSADQWYSTGHKPVIRQFSYDSTHKNDSKWDALSKRVLHAQRICQNDTKVYSYAKKSTQKRLIHFLTDREKPACKTTKDLRYYFGENLGIATYYCGQKLAKSQPYFYQLYPYGLSLNAYFKTGTQLLTNIAMHLLDINSTNLVENHVRVPDRSLIYSARSAYQGFREFLLGTPIGKLSPVFPS